MQNQAFSILPVAKYMVWVFREKASKIRSKRFWNYLQLELWALMDPNFEFLGGYLIFDRQTNRDGDANKNDWLARVGGRRRVQHQQEFAKRVSDAMPLQAGGGGCKCYRLCRRPLWELVLVDFILSVSIARIVGIVGRQMNISSCEYNPRSVCCIVC